MASYSARFMPRFETSALRATPSDVDALEYGLEGMQIEPDDYPDQHPYPHPHPHPPSADDRAQHDPIDDDMDDHEQVPRSWSTAASFTPLLSPTTMTSGISPDPARTMGSWSIEGATSMSFSPLGHSHGSGIQGQGQGQGQGPGSASTSGGGLSRSIPKRSALSRSWRAPPLTSASPSSSSWDRRRGSTPLRPLSSSTNKPTTRPPLRRPSFTHSTSHSTHHSTHPSAAPHSASSMPYPQSHTYGAYSYAPYPSPRSQPHSLPRQSSETEDVEDAEAAAAASILVGSAGSYRYPPTPDEEDDDETDEEVPVCLLNPTRAPSQKGLSTSLGSGGTPTMQRFHPTSAPSGLSRSLRPSVPLPLAPQTHPVHQPPTTKEDFAEDNDSDATDEGDALSGSSNLTKESLVRRASTMDISTISAAHAMASVRSQLGHACPAFVTKLWFLLDTPLLYQRYICWSHAGDKVLLAGDSGTSEEFATKVLPTLYRHSNLASFVRQLNLYGFQRLSTTRTLDADEIDLALDKKLISSSAANASKAALNGRIANGVTKNGAVAPIPLPSASFKHQPSTSALVEQTQIQESVLSALTPGLTAKTLYGPHTCFVHPLFRRGHPERLTELKPRASKKVNQPPKDERGQDQGW